MSIKKQNDHYSKVVEEAGNDQKALFKVANTLLDKGASRILPEHSDPLQLANEFNEYYLDKIDKLRKSIPETHMHTESNKFNGRQLSVFDPTNEEELEEIIKTFGMKTSPEDPIPADVLKSVIDVALPCLTKLVNKSMAEGTMESVKSSVIDPLLKNVKLDSEVNKNYRPVNNLVFFSKLTERVIKRRMYSHMTENVLHSHSQYAYIRSIRVPRQ